VGRTKAAAAAMLMGEGRSGGYERWARGAAAHAARTDLILEQATTKLELARVLTAIGKPDEAATEAPQALELFEAKGDQPNAPKARGMIDHLENH
jgi:hypothetical protein